MKKSIIVLFVMIMAVMMSAQAQQPSKKFISTYLKACELNKEYFSSIDSIPMGALVVFPAHNGIGLEIYSADEQNNSIWRLTERYEAGELVTPPQAFPKESVIDKKVPEKKVIEDSSNNNWSYWHFFWIILVILASLVFIAGAIYYMVQYAKKSAKNPDSYPPVGGNLDNVNRNQAISSLRRILREGETLVSLRRGKLVRTSGPDRIEVEMEFGDGRNRNIWLFPDERVATAIIRTAAGETIYRHMRSACSNGFGSDEFTLPNGWFIEYDETEAEGAIPESAPLSEPAPVVPEIKAPEVNYVALAQMIASCKKHDTIKIKIRPNELIVKAEKKSKKKKSKKEK